VESIDDNIDICWL